MFHLSDISAKRGMDETDSGPLTSPPGLHRGPVRRALGELTNSPPIRRTLGELTNSPPVRRALGELTNSPRLLSPSHSTTTPTKQLHGSGQLKQSPAITPTHNLKLLTDLAAKVAGANSSARQTLQFEDVDTGKYNNQSNNINNGNGLSSYSHYPILAASYRPEDEICDDYPDSPATQPSSTVEIRNVVSIASRTSVAEEKVTVNKKGSRGSHNAPAPLPPMPDESQLFAPPVERGNRKHKSLGLLAEKMLQNYPFMLDPGEYAEVHLDDTAKLLNTERRRIYDIVNVFEAVQIMSKVGKNLYNWHGRTFLLQSLAWLRQLGIKLGIPEQLRMASEQERENQDIENRSPLQSPRVTGDSLTASPLLSPYDSPYGSPGLSPYGSPNDPHGTSMGINTQKFLMLFLVSPNHKTLTLEFAARVIHGASPNDKAKVTRVRRLYDIANILQALGLITKVQLIDGKTRKPAFKYNGPVVEHLTLTEEEKRHMPATRQKNSLLAVGRNLAHLPDKEDDHIHATSASQLVSGVIRQKRARSVSGDTSPTLTPTGVRATMSSQMTSSVPRPARATSLMQLSEICGREMNNLTDRAASIREEHVERANTMAETLTDGGEPADNGLPAQTTMKPPTPGRPPSRKKVLLQRYFSDSALQQSSLAPSAPSTVSSSARTQLSFTSPSGASHSSISPNPRNSLHHSPSIYSPRTAVPFPSPLALKSSPQVSANDSESPKSVATSSSTPVGLFRTPQQHQTGLAKPTIAMGTVNNYLRSPVTPRDLRNAAILPPLSPSSGSGSLRTSRLACSPMGPVGRSLLSSPASPRSPIDLTTSRSHRRSAAGETSTGFLGRSPLASRSLNLPPSPQTSSNDSNSPKSVGCLSNTKTADNSSTSARVRPSNVSGGPPVIQVPSGLEMTSPLLRAYLANNKARIFKPAGVGEGVTVLGLSPPPTPGVVGPISSPSITHLDRAASSSSPGATSQQLTDAQDTVGGFVYDRFSAAAGGQTLFRRGALKLPEGDEPLFDTSSPANAQDMANKSGGPVPLMRPLPCFAMPLDFSSLVTRRQMVAATTPNNVPTDLSQTAK